MKEEKIEEHPSWGLVSVARVGGGASDLFQSDFDPGHFIRLEVRRAKRKDNWVRGTGPDLIEIDLTPMQFAEMVTTMNMGEGTPCTIRRLPGERIEGPERQTDAAPRRVADEFAEDLRELRQFATEASRLARDLLSKGGKMKAADRDELGEIVGKLSRYITNSMPFAMQQIEESLGKMTGAAKAALTSHAAQLGVGADAIPQIPGLVDPAPGPVEFEPEPDDPDWEPPEEMPPPPELRPRDVDTQDLDKLPVRDVAERISRVLARFERQQREDGTFAGRKLFHARAWESNGRVGVTLVSYQSSSLLTREQAIEFCAALEHGASVETMFTIKQQRRTEA
jgi:hypothetical protein